MEYTREIIISLVPAGDIPVVRIKQGDSSTRFIRITVMHDDEPYIPGAEETILFRCEKPDGHGVLLDDTYLDTALNRYFVVRNEDGSITVELTSQTSTCPGYCRCDLCFVKGDRAISTAPFLLDVEAAPGITGSVVSSDDFKTLINALRDVGLSSTTSLTDMTDVLLNNVQSGQILIYDSTAGKWVNKAIPNPGYLTADTVRPIIEGYQYQTADQVNVLIAAYINGLDGNNTEY